jgi:hypothetical protein
MRIASEFFYPVDENKRFGRRGFAKPLRFTRTSQWWRFTSIAVLRVLDLTPATRFTPWVRRQQKPAFCVKRETLLRNNPDGGYFVASLEHSLG